jgi:tetratricopeptide (TPR) repeat protein
MNASALWVGSVVLCCAFGASAAKPGLQPPAQWADYITAVRKADVIVDDEARCNAYPDLPGNEWRPGAAQGRCSILRKPDWSLDDIDRLLATPEGVAELERGFAALLDAHYRDQSRRDQVFIAFDVFDTTGRSGEIAQRWLSLAPKSPFAHVAAGVYYGSSGWQARGTRWARETPEDQLRRMSELFAKAVPLYLRALELEPRLSVACYKLNGIGRQSSDALQQYAASHCTKVDPDSYFLALERITTSEPRWGGSDEQLRHAVAYAAARTDRNPMMGALLGEAAGYAPSLADHYGTVADELAAAARMGPSAGLSAKAGRGYWNKKEPWAALVYLSQGVRFRPRDHDTRYARAAVLHDWLGESEWARSDIEAALREEPDNSYYLHLQGRITQELEGYVAARPFFKHAMNGERRQAAMEMYCQTYILPELVPAAADTCTRDLVGEFPESGEGWRLRAWVLYKARDPGVLEAVEQFTRHAQDTSLHRESLEKMRTNWAPELERLRKASTVPSSNHGK